jgi:hypothetical protein
MIQKNMSANESGKWGGGGGGKGGSKKKSKRGRNPDPKVMMYIFKF